MNDPFEVFDFKDEKDWLSGRMNGIGGSDASAVVGMNPYKSNINLFEEKTGRRIPEDISGKACVIYGKYAEGPIRELFKLDYPEYKVEHHEFRILRSIKHPFMQASLDGELTDQDGRKGILEIKTTNILQSMQKEKWRDRVPDNYYIQVLHYLLVTGYEFIELCAHLRTDWGGELVSYDPLDEEIEVDLIEDDVVREETPAMGYYAMFEYENGFRKTMYWSKKKMLSHAEKYSQAFRKNGGAKSLELLEQGKIPEKDLWKYSSFWFKDFDGMAMKTMLRQLISKWGIMSIDLQTALDKDMAVIHEDGTTDYVDTQPEQDNVVADQELQEVKEQKEKEEPAESRSIEDEFFQQ